MLDQLLKDLNSRKKTVREAAIRQARALPPEQLLQLAEREAKAFRRRTCIIGVVLSGFCVLAFLANLQSLLKKSHPGFDDWFMVFQPLLMAIGGFGFVSSSATRGRWSLASVIAETNDPRFIGPALNFLTQTGDDKVKMSIRRALRYLLPRMSADQAEALTLEQRHALLKPLLWPYENVELSLSILKALEQVGDEKAIPVIKKLAEEGAATHNMRRVKQAAQDCLPYLQIRMEQLKQAQTLLRASDASTTVASDVLLRPAAANVSETPPEQLLRAARSEN